MPTPAANAVVVTSVAAADPVKLKERTRQLSIGGLLTAIILVILIVKMVWPTSSVALLALTSLCLAIVVIEVGLKTAVMTYLAATLLSIAWPGLAVSFGFIVFFGPYPLIRALIDKMFGRITALVLKLITGNILVALTVVLFLQNDLMHLSERYTFFWALVPILLQVALLIYDYALGMLIQFYMTRIRKNK